MDIPQVLGYTRIAGMPLATGPYTLLLPLLAFKVKAAIHDEAATTAKA